MRYAFVEDKRITNHTRDMIELANHVATSYDRQGLRITLRQLYYQFVQKGWIENKKEEYDRLTRVVSIGRDMGIIDWDVIVDRLRDVEKPFSRRDGQHAIEMSGKVFQLDPWISQECRVEVWVEKDALSEVIEHACRELRVPFLVCRGYLSQTAVYEAATRMLDYIAGEHSTDGTPQQPVVLHLGDHDPSGMHMSEDNHRRLMKYMERWNVNAELVRDILEFRRIALSMEQIEELKPPPNDAKLKDPRSKGYVKEFGEVSWELDALPPDYLIKLVKSKVRPYIDFDSFNAALDREQEIKEEIADLAANYKTKVAGKKPAKSSSLKKALKRRRKSR